MKPRKKAEAEPEPSRFTLEITGEVGKLLQLQPNDILVFSVPYNLTAEQLQQLRTRFNEALAEYGITNRSIVLPSGSTLNAIRLEDSG